MLPHCTVHMPNTNTLHFSRSFWAGPVFQPCVFLNKMRLGFNVIVNLYVMRPTAPKFIVFFQKMRFATLLRFTFLVISQVQCVLGSQVIVNSHVMRPTTPCFLIFSKENVPRKKNPWPSLQLQIFIRAHAREGQMLTEEHCM